MSYLIAGSFKKKPSHLAIFLPLVLVSYGTTIVSANATEAGLLDKASNLSLIKKLKTGKGFQAVRGSPIDINTDPTDGSELVSAAWVMMDPPLPSPRVTFHDSITGEEVTKAWRQMETKEIVRLLNNKTIQVTTGQFDATGKVSYLNAKTTGKVGKYRVLMDYTPYMVEDFVDETNKKIGTAKIGVGYRLIADITTYKANVDVSNLPALSAAAKLKKLDGQMTIETIGITLDNNSGILLSPKTIDDKSIAENLRALDILQSRITDKGTSLDPKVIWVKPLSAKATINKPIPWWRRIFNR